jgi:CMP-N-acetylneuraminic acid synthetase
MLLGKPLLAYTVEPAVASGCFQEILVSSDDTEILTLAKSLGALSDARPMNLSGDTTKAVEVVHEIISRPEMRDRFDAVSMCLPTCPFRSVEDVRLAVSLFKQTDTKCHRLLSVTAYEFPPQLALVEKNQGLLQMREPDAYDFSTRSQDIGKLFHPNGAIYISTIAEFLRSGTFFGQPMLKYEMPAERSFDIDYEYQFHIAEKMMQTTQEGQ